MHSHLWSLVVTFGHSWSLVVYSWSLVVTRGHSWSFVVTRGHSCVLLDTISVGYLKAFAKTNCSVSLQNKIDSGNLGPADRPVPIVLVKCWKVAHWNAKKLLKNCQKSKKLLPKFQKLLPKFLAIFI